MFVRFYMIHERDRHDTRYGRALYYGLFVILGCLPLYPSDQQPS